MIDEDTENRLLAKAALSPEHVAADLLSRLNGLDWTVATRELRAMQEQALGNPGDTRMVERMLLSQATILQALFARYAEQSTRADTLPKAATLADLAMKAQNQCRRTLATLAEVRNPRRAMFVKQLNQAVNQQVNNTSGATEIRKIPESKAGELLEVDHAEGRRLDFGAATMAIPNDAGLATVGAQYRSPDAGGESPEQQERPQARNAR